MEPADFVPAVLAGLGVSNASHHARYPRCEAVLDRPWLHPRIQVAPVGSVTRGRAILAENTGLQADRKRFFIAQVLTLLNFPSLPKMGRQP